MSGLLSQDPLRGLLYQEPVPQPQGLLGALTMNPLMAGQVAAQRAANSRPDVTDLFGYGPTWQSYLQNTGANLQAQTPSLQDSTEAMVQKALGMLGNFGAFGATKIAPTKHLPMPEKLFTPPAPSREVLDKAGRVETVPLQQVRATESPIERTKGRPDRGPLIEGYADRPVAARMSDGTYLLYDGHRRSEAALNRGAGALDMYVVDVKNYAPGADQKLRPTLSAEDLDRLFDQLR